MTKLITAKKAIKGIISLGLILPAFALAQAASGVGGITGQAPVVGSGVQLNDIIITIINWATGLLILLAVVFIIWAAFIYLTAGGDTEKVGKANKILIYAAVAIAIALLAQGIVFIVGQLATSGQVQVSEGGVF